MIGDGKSELLRETLNLLPNPVCIRSRDRAWVEVNEAFCRFTGQPRSALIGRRDFDGLPKDQAEMFGKLDRRVLESR